jgi:ribonuclease HI
MKKTAVCDGACSRNPGPGGWAYALVDGDDVQYYSGSSEDTTNNIMELTAFLNALKCNPDVIYTDSTYVVDGVNKWMRNWARNGWKTAKKETIKNLDLWQEIHNLYNRTPVMWVPGHANPKDEPDPVMREIISIQIQVDNCARQRIKA